MHITIRTLLTPTTLYTQRKLSCEKLLQFTAGCSHWLRNVEHEAHGFVSGTCYSEQYIR